jgi:hypothetical protein
MRCKKSLRFLRDIMKRISMILLLTGLIFNCSKVSFGQLVSDDYCKKIENIVATPFKPIHWYHNIAFSDECSLEFDIDKKVVLEFHLVSKKVNLRNSLINLCIQILNCMNLST